MSESAKHLIDLFHQNNDNYLCLFDYMVIDDYEKAIRELENLGIIKVCNDVIASIELV